MENKKCKDCNENKSLDNFSPHKKCKYGVTNLCKECIKVRSINHRINNPITQMISNTKSSAKKRGIEFSLKKEDIIIPEFCPYTGLKLTLSAGKGLLKTAACIDRIDNNGGYIKDNIMIVSFLANKIKGEMSIPELLIFCKNALKIHD